MIDIMQLGLFIGLSAYAILLALALVMAPRDIGILDRFFDWIISPWV